MQKRFFKLIGLMLVLLWVIPYSNGALGNNSPSGSNSATGDPVSSVWVNKYPQLANMQQKISSNTNKIPPSKKPFVGNITNQFGIRDDILRNIAQSIPAANESALYHALKYAQYSQAIYLFKDKNGAFQNMQDMIYAIDCLSNSYGMINTHNLILKNIAIKKDNQFRLTQVRKTEQLLAFNIFKLDNKAVNNDCHIGGKY
ncbi:MAG: hypothetical protein K0R94_973 [Burkholderiales bacterium]|jgi:hypothetical protein|nr:hypothetical protein [Burkholderiales bacterium]